MKKALSLVLAVVMIAMAFSGCVRTQSTLKFNEDNTCDLNYTIAVMAELLMDQETGEVTELFSEESLEGFKEIGFKYEKYAKDGFEGYTFTAKEDMAASTGKMGAFGQDPMFFIEKDKVIFSYPMLTGQSEEELAETAAMFEMLGGFGLITIEFPFAPIESNATSVSVDGKSLTWNILEGGNAYAEFSLEDFTKAGMVTSYMTENPFEDVEYGTYYHDAVLWAYENGITTGTTATKFAPASTCTRGQVVTFLWRAMGEPEPETTENPFTDVAESDYFYKAVLWAVENGITTGTSATKFSPATTCSNAHILTFIWRTFGEPEKTGEGEWYTDAVNWAEAGGLLDGIYEGEFDPTADCPRSDVVTYLYRSLNVSTTDVMTGTIDEILYGALGEVEE